MIFNIVFLIVILITIISFINAIKNSDYEYLMSNRLNLSILFTILLFELWRYQTIDMIILLIIVLFSILSFYYLIIPSLFVIYALSTDMIDDVIIE